MLVCFFTASYSQHRKLGWGGGGGVEERAEWFLHGRFDLLKVILVFNLMYCAFVALKANKISNILNHAIYI